MKRSHLRDSQASVETIIPWRDHTGGAYDVGRKNFRETTLADVERSCGRSHKLATSNKRRYQVLAITGFTIVPASGSESGGGKEPRTIYSILDSARNWIEVAHFGVRSGGEKAARKLCREMNANDR